MSERTLRLLLVEDNLGDIRLMEEALRASAMPVRMRFVRDGVEAMLYLRRQGKHADAEAPDVVVLDLNLPRKDGRTVLREIKQDPALRHLPVVVLTTSDHDRDIKDVYSLQAASYLIKPDTLEEFFRMMKSALMFLSSRVRPFASPLSHEPSV